MTTLADIAKQQEELRQRIEEVRWALLGAGLLPGDADATKLADDMVRMGHIRREQRRFVHQLAAISGVESARRFFVQFVALEPDEALTRLRELTQEIATETGLPSGDAGIEAIARHPALAMQANRARHRDEDIERKFLKARGIELELLAAARAEK